MSVILTGMNDYKKHSQLKKTEQLILITPENSAFDVYLQYFSSVETS